MAPTRYGDLNKKSNDLLTNDYCFDKKFKLTTKTDNGVTLTGEATVGKTFDLKGTAKFSYGDVSFDKLQVTGAGRVIGELTFKNVVKNTDCVVKMEDGGGKDPSGVVELKMSHNKFTADTSVDVTKTIVGLAATYQLLDDLTVGVSSKFDTQFDNSFKGAALKDLDLSAAYRNKGVTTTVATKGKFTGATLSLHSDYDRLTQVGAAVEADKSAGLKAFSVGGIYAIDAASKLQAKVDNKGVVSANYILQIQPQVKGIVSARVNAMNITGDDHTLGFSLIIG